MKVLVVNAYDESKKGKEDFNDFRRCVFSCLAEARDGIPSTSSEDTLESVVVRRPYNLMDYVLDYKHEMLDDRAKAVALAFDNLDYIFIGGDMSYLPWDPKCALVVNLIANARKVDKPVLCAGSGAMMMVYAVCTGGTKYHLLNEPYGESLDRLPSFNRYAPDSGQYPSAWLNNKNGDLYTYDTHRRCWIPQCNTGMFLDSTGVSQARHFPKVKGSRNAAEKIAHIHSMNTHRDYLENLNTCNIPVLMVSDTWYLSWTGKLPARLQIETLADGPNGPVMLTIERSLLLGCEIKDRPKFAALRRLMVNYFRSLQRQIDQSANGKLCTSLYEYLFEKAPGKARCAFELEAVLSAESDASNAMSGGAPALRKNVAPPVGGGMPISTSLPRGPVKVDAPVMNFLFSTRSKKIKSPGAVLSSDGRHTGQTQDAHISSNFQNPKLLRRHRLERLLEREWKYRPEEVTQSYNIDGVDMAGSNGGHEDLPPKSKFQLEREKNNRVIKDLLESCAQIGIRGGNSQLTRATDVDQVQDQQLPESAREHFSGLYMDDKNIKQRRDLPMGVNDSHVSGSINANYSMSLAVDSYAMSMTQDSAHSPQSLKVGSKVPPVAGWQQSISESTVPTKPKQTRPKSGSAVKNMSARGISARLTEKLLVHKHPNSARAPTKRTEQVNSPTSDMDRIPSSSGQRKDRDYSLYAPYTNNGEVTNNSVAVQIPNPHVGPFNNSKKYEAMANQEKKSPYKGSHKVPFQTEREREIEAYQMSKEKFLAGSFKTSFGKASELPMRPIGVVQNSGPYKVRLEHPPDEHKERILCGPWKPNGSKPSYSK